MHIRATLSGTIATALILAGGWLAGAFAVNTGDIDWIHFTSGSGSTPLCGVDRASLQVDSSQVTFAGSERAYNRSGGTCTSTHARPAGYVRAHLYLYENGALVFHDYADNLANTYNARISGAGPAGSLNCFQAAVSGREYDSDNAGYRADILRYTSQLCNT